MDRLGLTEEELCEVLGLDPLAVISGELDHKPQLPILLALTEEAVERVGEDMLRRWLRAAGPAGPPIEHLRAGDFAAFEDDLATLAERGLVLRGGGRSDSAGRRGGPADHAGGAERSGGGPAGRAGGAGPRGGGTAGAGRTAGGPTDRAAGAGKSPPAPSGRGTAGAATGLPHGDNAIQVRRIRPDEAAIVRATRLRALADAPLAFGSTHEREAAYPPAKWESWAREGARGELQVLLLAVDPAAPAAPIGLAFGVVDADDPAVVHLYSMWVAPEARGTGAGSALVEAVARWATERGAATLRTPVTLGNDRAARLYANRGFRDTGVREPLGHSGAETAVLERDLVAGEPPPRA